MESFFLRFWNRLEMWQKFGLSFIGAVVILVLIRTFILTVRAALLAVRSVQARQLCPKRDLSREARVLQRIRFCPQWPD